MGYYDKDEPEVIEESEPTLLDRAEQGVSLAVRLLGMGVLLFGLWIGITVLLEGWALYEDPERIERVAIAIERGSNLDAMFAGLTSDDATVAEGAARPTSRSLRLTYFAAWFVVIALLMVVGMLAMSAIATGGQLAVRDVRVARRSRRFAPEERRLRRAA